MSGTAEIHDATLTPTKLALLATWLPAQEWFVGDADDAPLVDGHQRNIRIGAAAQGGDHVEGVLDGLSVGSESRCEVVPSA